ncbi:geobacter CxxxxCH...CXXCH motif protein [Geobacter sp. OR-1]|nr:geobacter CxxxxCH...CXXCH motif protein [Geobacter sp. OR-1]
MTTIRLNKGEINMTRRNLEIKRSCDLKGLLSAFGIMVVVLLSATGSQGADLLHNSVDTGSNSSKWPNGWGVTGGKYGQFTCDTCHEPNNRENLKNIRTVIHTPDGDLWPNGQQSVSVTFTNQTGMGGDTRAHADSNRICEVCHSQNKFHNANSANNSAGLGHPSPKEVCTSCHAHNTGFKAACGGCHGNPPVSSARGGDTGLIGKPKPSFALQTSAAGAHATHVTGRSLVCDTCHYIDNGTARMPSQSGTIDIGFFGFGGKVTSGTYTPFTSSRRGYPFASGTASTVIAPGQTDPLQANRCANVYCHGAGAPGKAPLTGGTNQTPRWDASGQSACGSCHGATSSNPPTMGSHAVHAGSATGYGYDCNFCHPATDISHVQGNVRWQFSATEPRVAGAQYQADGSGVAANAGSTGNMAPSPVYGTCSNVYCHFDKTPQWGSSLAGDCSGCHGNDELSATPMNKNAHKAHVNNRSQKFDHFDFKCYECHNSTVDSSNRYIINKGLHANSSKDVAWGPLAKTNGGGAQSYLTNGCATIYCHSDGNGNFRPPQKNWTEVADGTEGSVSCDYCHGGTIADTTVMTDERHNNHVRQSPAGGILHNGVGCDKCHDATVGPDGASIDYHTGTHLNGQRDITFAKFANRSGSWVGGTTRRCDNTYCHGRNNPTWGTTTINQCGTCHRATNTTSSGLSNAHRKHYNSGTAPVWNTNEGWTNVNKSATNNVFMCGTCHSEDPNTHHVNGPAMPNGAAAEVVINLPFVIPPERQYPAGGISVVTRGTTVVSDGAGYFYSQETSCATYCHSNGRGGAPVNIMSWDSSTTTCGNCHNKAGDADPTWSGAHTKHLTSTLSTAATCNACHAATASGNNTLISGRRDRHPNGFINVTGGSLAGGTMRWNGTSCSSVVCHYGGTTPNWVGGSMSGSRCTGCHGGTAGSINPMSKLGHKAHINNQTTKFGATRFNCNECHNTVVYANNTSILPTGTGLHVNGSGTVSWGPLSNGGVTYSSGNCTNIYCHSSGQATPAYRNPTAWTSIVNGAEGTVACDYCHNGTGLNGESRISTGRHTKHLANSGDSGINHKVLTCDTCHKLTTDSSYNLIPGGMHLNRARDVRMAKFANRSGVYSGSQCSVTYCHGRNNPNWTATTVNCGSCHQSNNSATFGLSSTHRKHYGSGTSVSNTNGWTNTNSSTQTAHVFYCGTCHNVAPLTDHVNGPVSVNGAAAQIVFNIPVVPAGAARPNTVQYGTGQRQDGAGYLFSSGTTCDVYCHSDGRGGAGKTAFLWTSTKFRCGECHNSAFDDYTAPTWSKPHTRHIRGYYEAGNANVSCYSCHAATVMSNNTSISDKRRHINGYRNISSTAAFAKFTWNGTNCSNGYCHSDGKATSPAFVAQSWTSVPANCTGCHGNASANGGNNSALSGKHAKHVEITTYGFRCASCHAKTVDAGNDLALKQYTGAKYHVNKIRNVVMDARYGGTWTSPSCTNVYCHSNGQATPTYSNPNWTSLTTTCTSCHGNATSNTLSARHQNHLNPAVNTSLGLGNGLLCADCHAKTVATNSSISNYANHANRFAEFFQFARRRQRQVQSVN